VCENVQKATAFDGDDDLFEGDAALRQQLAILVWIPTKGLHWASVPLCVPFVAI
jgi:hypothetical protein